MLSPLPAQPADTPWPTHSWPRGEPILLDGEAFERLTRDLFELKPEQGVTYALLIAQNGRLVYARYGAGANPIYLQYSWSMAKSITQALVGLAVADGRLNLHAPAPVPEWQLQRQDGTPDPRQRITLDQLLRMRSGLHFNEDYVDGQVSHVIPMLFEEGRRDTGAFAAAMPPAAPPERQWSYSSGTTNIICRILRDRIGGPTEMLAFMRDRLFEPIGMRSATPRFDHAGTFIGSSFLLATPEDFLRFGLLYLRGGSWEGRPLLTPAWVDYARTPNYSDATQAYGAHWWLTPGRSWFYASGYDGQRLLLVPEKDLAVLRLGRTRDTEVQPVWDALHALVDCFPERPPTAGR